MHHTQLLFYFPSYLWSSMPSYSLNQDSTKDPRSLRALAVKHPSAGMRWKFRDVVKAHVSHTSSECGLTLHDNSKYSFLEVSKCRVNKKKYLGHLK